MTALWWGQQCSLRHWGRTGWAQRATTAQHKWDHPNPEPQHHGGAAGAKSCWWGETRGGMLNSVVTSSHPPGSQVAQRHAEDLAQLQAEVGMLRCHMERTGPWLPPAILPPPVAPPIPPALAAPELFMVRALSRGCSQVSRGAGRSGQAADPNGMMDVEVWAWGDDSGAAALATAGDTGAPQSQDHQGRRLCAPPRVLNHRCDLLCTPAPCGALGVWAALAGASCRTRPGSVSC